MTYKVGDKVHVYGWARRYSHEVPTMEGSVAHLMGYYRGRLATVVDDYQEGHVSSQDEVIVKFKDDGHTSEVHPKQLRKVVKKAKRATRRRK